MPAVRLSRRRRSSHAIFTPARPGTYGIPASSRPVQFAPNVTPVTFTDPEEDDIDALAAAVSSGSLDPSTLDSALFDGDGNSSLFPPLENPAAPPARKRCPPGKRRSQGYIPRPPNAFMLFRADFVKQKHVPGSIETNHGSLSKIIGTCWHNLPDSERRVWQNRAKIEKAKHKALYPDYRFRPVHNKEKKAAAAAARAETDARSASVNLTKHKQFADDEDERRCEDISQLLLSGKKGEELALAMQELDRQRERDSVNGSAYGHSPSNSRAATPSAINLLPQVQHIPHVVAPQPMFNPNFGATSWANHASSNMGYSMHRRSSSVPLPNDFSFAGMQHQGIALPSVPQFGFHSRPASPVRISNQNNFSMSSAPTPFNNGFANMSLAPNAPAPSNPNNNGNRSLLGLRRPSSAQPILRRSWTMPGFESFDNSAYMPSYHDSQLEMMPFDMSMSFSTMMGMPNVDMNSYLQQEPDEPLPEPETSLFESGFSLGGSSMGSVSSSDGPLSMSPKVDEAVDPSAPMPANLSMEHMHASMSPSSLDAVSPLTCASTPAGTPPQPTQNLEMDAMYGAHGMTQYDQMSMPMGNGMEMMYNQNMYAAEMNMGYVC